MDTNAKKTDSDVTPEKNHVEVGRFRRALPQFLATSAKNLILLDLGMTMAFPTLVIPALLKSDSEVHFDHTLASWFASIMFICQPLGSLVSGTVLEPLGRKNSMLLVNIPHLLGWYLFYSSLSVSALFVAAIIMGLGVGFMEAPVITYVGEISEPRLRGMLTSYSGLFLSIGMIVELSLGTLYGWKTTAFISSFVPIVTIIAISLVPETPMWLLSRNRQKDAEKSLCWLRGWVPAAAVQKELKDLVRYRDNSRYVLPENKHKATAMAMSVIGKPEAIKTAYTNPVVSLEDEGKQQPNANNVAVIDRSVTAGAHLEEVRTNGQIRDGPEVETVIAVERKATFKERFRDMVRPQMRKPMMLVVAFFIFLNGTGFPAMRPYLIHLFEELRFPIDSHWASVVITCIGFIGVIICTFSIRHIGKRKLALVSLVGCAVSLLGLSLWALLDEKFTPGSSKPSWTPFCLFITLSFSFSFGIAPVPWIILSEVFPYRGRGFASGVAAAISYIMGAITSKTFLDLKLWFHFSGVFMLYGFITIVGFVYVYFKLPETEGKSLEDIEDLYKSKKAKI